MAPPAPPAATAALFTATMSRIADKTAARRFFIKKQITKKQSIMAQLKEIFERESRRTTPELCLVINLFLEGTFYRAYEWSAWLCVRYISGFKVTKRMVKTQEGSMVLVGFPITSLQKFTPQNSEVSFNDDKSVSIKLPLSMVDEYADVETMSADFANWKQSVPRSDSNGKSDNTIENHSNGVRVSDILREILIYPVEQKSPIECMNFILSMKQKISSII